MSFNCSLVPSVQAGCTETRWENTTIVLGGCLVHASGQRIEVHVLVGPKTSLQNSLVYDLEEEIASSLGKTVRRVARAVRRVYEPEGLSIWQSNGAAAFQEVPHVHWHVLPRYSNDGLLVVYPAGVPPAGARGRSMQFLKTMSGPLIEALRDEVV